MIPSNFFAVYEKCVHSDNYLSFDLNHTQIELESFSIFECMNICNFLNLTYTLSKYEKCWCLDSLQGLATRFRCATSFTKDKSYSGNDIHDYAVYSSKCII